MIQSMEVKMQGMMLNQCLEAAQKSFIWTEHLPQVLTTAFLSMVPTFEGRYAVVTGLAMGMPILLVYVLAVVFSSLPIPFIFLLLRRALDWFYTLPIAPVRKFAHWLEQRAARKREGMNAGKQTGVMGWMSRHVSSETLELIGLYIFVALPLPGTGAWTGSAVATLFEMPKLKSALVIVLGNATACLITTLAATGIIHIFA